MRISLLLVLSVLLCGCATTEPPNGATTETQSRFTMEENHIVWMILRDTKTNRLYYQGCCQSYTGFYEINTSHLVVESEQNGKFDK